MSARVWNYLTGYVIIEFKGKGLERFINRTVHSGTLLWCIRRTAADAVSACMSIESFCKLRGALRGTGIRTRILEKRGLPLVLSRSAGRAVLLFGWIAVVLALVIASRFVWFISVEGCDRVKKDEVVEILAHLGVRRGMPRSKTGTFAIGSEIASRDARIAWAGARLEGVILRVDIYEEKSGVPKKESDEAASLYAAKDGVVTRVIVTGGKANVVVGDAVRAGQVLISEVIREDETASIHVRAKGTVLARVLYRANGKADAAYGAKRREHAAGEAEKALAAMLPREARMLSKRCEYTENEDGSVTADITVIMEENIASYRGTDGE